MFLETVLKLPNDEIQRLKFDYELRSMMVRFLSQMISMDLHEHLSLNINAQGEVHLTDCAWCNDDIDEGPDSCHCLQALKNPQSYVSNTYGIGMEDEEKLFNNILEKIRKKRNENLHIMNYMLLEKIQTNNTNNTNK